MSEWKKYTGGSVESDLSDDQLLLAALKRYQLMEVYAYCVLCLNLASLANNQFKKRFSLKKKHTNPTFFHLQQWWLTA